MLSHWQVTCGLSSVRLVTGDAQIKFDYGMLSPTSKTHTCHLLSGVSKSDPLRHFHRH